MRSLLLCLLASLSVPAFQNATTWTSGYDGIHRGDDISSFDWLFDARPYGTDSILVIGVRADSTYCKPDAPFIFGIRQANRCVADNTVEMWDRTGNLLWKRFQKIEFPSYWFGSTILSNGDILSAGNIRGDTLEFDTSSLARNAVVRTARISRWNRAGDLVRSWRITSAPDSSARGYSGVNIHWIDTLANGDIVFLGRSSYTTLIIPRTDTIDISSSFPRFRNSNLAEAGFFGCLSSQAQLRWLRHVPLYTKSISLNDGISALTRGNEIIVAHSVPQDTLGTTTVVLSRYDASGNLLGESSPLGSTPATVNGIAKSEDGTLLLSISPDSNTVQIAGKTVAIPSDSAFLQSSSTPTTGRNLLLLIDSALTPLLAKPLSGLRRPGSWNVGNAPGHGWLAWGEDWTGYNDTAYLIRLDDSLRIQETSSQLNGVHSAHAYGDELWLSGSIKGATKTGNGGTMMATRMEFDPPRPVGVSSRTSRREPASFRIQGRSLHWLGTSEGSVRISSPSGRIEWQGTLQPNGSLPLQAGMHFVQIQGHTQTIAVP